MSQAARKAHKRDRRADLIEAGIKLLALERLPRVEDITAEAQTGKGTFYLYFDCWEAFLAAVRDRLLEDYQIEMQSRLGAMTRDTYWHIVEKEIGLFVRWLISHGRIHRVVFHGAEAGPPIPTELAASNTITRLIEIGQEYGLVSSNVSAPVAAKLILGVLHAGVDSADHDRIDEAMPEITRFVASALTRQEAQ